MNQHTLTAAPQHLAMHTWPDALAAFEAHLNGRDLAAATVESYVRDLTWLGDGVQSAPWTLRTAELQAWLIGHNWSRRTHMRITVSLRAFYRFGIESGACERSPLIGVQTLKLKRSGPTRQQPTAKWREPIEAFQRYLLAGGRAATTIEHYGYRLTFVSTVLADPWKVTTDDLANYLARDDWSPNTKRMHRAAISRFYAWARRVGRIDVDPTEYLDSVRVPRKLPRPAPDDALSTALEAADDRTRLAIELGALAGLRRSEIARLRWDQLAPGELLVDGKGGNWRRVPMHPDLTVSLHAARERADRAAESGVRSPFVFPSPHGGHLTSGHVAKLIRDCIPDGAFTPHGLRHRFASQAYAATLDLRAVQELLGHTKPETTAIYAAVPDGALAAAVRGARLGILPTPLATTTEGHHHHD